MSYSKVEEDRTSVWSGSERDYEDKELGIAAIIGSVPDSYFSGYDLNILSGDPGEDKWIFGYTTDKEFAMFDSKERT